MKMKLKEMEQREVFQMFRPAPWSFTADSKFERPKKAATNKKKHRKVVQASRKENR